MGGNFLLMILWPKVVSKIDACHYVQPCSVRFPCCLALCDITIWQFIHCAISGFGAISALVNLAFPSTHPSANVHEFLWCIPSRGMLQMLRLLNDARLSQFILPPASMRVPVPKPCCHNLILSDLLLVYSRFVMENNTFHPTLTSSSCMLSFQGARALSHSEPAPSGG